MLQNRTILRVIAFLFFCQPYFTRKLRKYMTLHEKKQIDIHTCDLFSRCKHLIPNMSARLSKTRQK